MRTDEEILTLMAVGEIPCPCTPNCMNERDMQNAHPTVQRVLTCISRYGWPRLNGFLKISEQAMTIPPVVSRLMQLRTTVAMSVFDAMEFESRRFRLHACNDQDELQGLLAHYPWEILEGVFRRCYEAAAAKYQIVGPLAY